MIGYTPTKKGEKFLASLFFSKLSVSANSALDSNDESLASISHFISTINSNIISNINNSDID